jgi:hypothetical protein
MSEQVVDQIKDATKDILSEDNLAEIQSAFDDAVATKVQLHVEKALLEQDTAHAEKLNKLLVAIDEDHTKKLGALVEAIDQDHSGKLSAIVQRHQGVLSEQADNFKQTLVENISNYLELYLEKVAPKNLLDEAVTNRRSADFLAELRNLLAVDTALSKNSIRNAVQDGKSRLDEAATAVIKLQEENDALKKRLSSTATTKALDEKCRDLDDEKRAYVTNLLKDKDVQFINENFDYTVAMFDKTEEQRLDEIKADAVVDTVARDVDRPILEESVTPTKSGSVGPNDPYFNEYMGELGKY